MSRRSVVSRRCDSAGSPSMVFAARRRRRRCRSASGRVRRAAHGASRRRSSSRAATIRSRDRLQLFGDTATACTATATGSASIASTRRSASASSRSPIAQPDHQAARRPRRHRSACHEITTLGRITVARQNPAVPFDRRRTAAAAPSGSCRPRLCSPASGVCRARSPSRTRPEPGCRDRRTSPVDQSLQPRQQGSATSTQAAP